MKTPNPPPMFANILEETTLVEDAAGAMFLILGAIPTAFFLLLTVLSPAPAACVEASPDVAASSHAQLQTPARSPAL